MAASLRNPIFDNAKFIMVFIVILGHFIEPFIHNLLVFKALYLFIYSFHIPVFVMLAGMLSSIKLDWSRFKKLIRGIIVPFIVFTVIYELGHFIMFDEISGYLKLILPYWLLWFLPSLFFWRVTLPFVHKIPFYVLMSILLSLYAGTIIGFDKVLGFSRTLHFWPFFLLGYKLTPDYFSNPKWTSTPKYIWAFILITALVGFWLAKDMDYRLFYGKLPYESLNQDTLTGIAIKLWIYLVSFIMSFAIIGIIPKNIFVPEHWKRNTLFAYLWHGLLIKIASFSGLIIIMSNWDQVSLLAALLIISIFLTTVLSSKYIASFTQMVLFKPFDVLLKR